jgi:UrcA family protein
MANVVLKGGFAAAVTASLMLGAAHAASAPTAQLAPDDPTVTTVEVTVPRVITGSRIGMPTTEYRMSKRVPYGDLDMATAAGVAELNRRVEEAADYVCDRLEQLNPAGEPEKYSCAREAVRDARPQVVAARER